MRFDFKKIASVFASAVMLGSTAGMALAANYPAPIVVGGAADGAIVITSGDHPGSQVDFWAAIDLQSALQGLVTATGTTTAASISGEAYPLFTSGSKIYMNDSINKVKEILTDVELPIILADQSFAGNVDADVTQTITLTSWPQVTFAKQPTSDEDPSVGLTLYTTKGKDLYNLTITFDKATNLTHDDSEGEDITLFGQKFNVAVATDATNLILYKSSTTIDLSVGGTSPNPSETVTVEGKEYTVTLTAATDTSATIRLTDSAGKTSQKEIKEGASKKILDIEVAINLADESAATNSISAEVTVGAQKVKLTDGNEVKLGSDETAVDGTNVVFSSGLNTGNMTKFVIQVAAPDSSSDAIIPGGAFIDPVFGTFKVDFVGLNINEDSTARETLEIKTTQDKGTLKMTTYSGDEKTITWYNNESAAAALADGDRDYIRVREMASVNETEYVVVGNEDEGYLLEVVDIANGTTGYSDDAVKLKDVFSGKTYTATITSEGRGTITVGGKEYGVYYTADKTGKGSEAFFINLNYPDSTTAGQVVMYPTIQTSKGAKVAFYEPQTINLSAWDGATAVAGADVSGIYDQAITGLIFPDGNNYETTVIIASSGLGNWTVNVGGTAGYGINTLTDANAVLNTTINVADGNTNAFSYNMTGSGGMVTINLLDNAKAKITVPALMVFEEEDDNNDILGFIVQMEGAGTSADEVGVQDIEFPASKVGASKTISDFLQLETDDDLYKWVNLWGVYATIDKSESSQYTATISYPDEQIYAQIYAAEVSASVTGETVTGGGGQILVVKDTEVSSVSGRNIVVVGGTCINAAAAKILDVSKGTCGADWTAKTNVGPGQYLIKAVTSPYNSAKTAILVAGYEAADTKNAVAKLKESHVTNVGTSEVYPKTAA